MNIDSSDTSMASKLRAILLELARREHDRAAHEAAAAPYWSSTPATVLGHRNAAAMLRAEADRIVGAA